MIPLSVSTAFSELLVSILQHCFAGFNLGGRANLGERVRTNLPGVPGGHLLAEKEYDYFGVTVNVLNRAMDSVMWNGLTATAG